MSIKVGEAYVELTARLDQYDKQLKDAQGKLNNFSKTGGSSFGDLAKGALKFAAVIGTLRLAYTQLIKPASDFEETTNKFNVTFADVADQANKTSEELRKAFGLSRMESKKLLSDTGDLLTGFGATGKQALDLSTKVQALAADLASFTNVEGGVSRASQALTSALLGEREQAKSLDIVIREADIQARLAAKGKSDLTGMDKQLAVAEETLAIATEQSKNAIGDFARSSDSFANQSRTLNSLLEDMAVIIGTPLKNALNSGTGAILENGDAILGLAESFVGAFDKIIDSYGAFDIGESAVGDFIDTVSTLVDLFGDVSAVLIDFGATALKPVFDTMGEGDGVLKNLQAAFKGIGSFIKENEEAFHGLAEILSYLVKVIVFVATQLMRFGKAVLEPIVFAVKKFFEAVDAGIKKLQEWGILSKKVSIEGAVLSETVEDQTKKNQDHAQSIQAVSDKWKKAREEAKSFADELAQSLESPGEKIDRIQSEQLNKLEQYKKQRLLTEQEYADAKVAIYAQTENAIQELRQQTFDQNMALTQQSFDVTTEFLGVLSEAFQVDEDNRLIAIENRKNKKLDQLNSEYEKEKAILFDTVKNTKKRDKKLEELEDKKQEQEDKIEKEAEKKKAKIQRENFEREKAFRIVQTIMATGQAVMSALAGPFPASIAFAALAGAMGIAQIAVIAAQKPPAMAQGGIVKQETLATIGEAGTEAVLPLTGPQGARTREMFANDLISAIGMQTQRAEIKEPEIERDMIFNVQVNIGGDQFYGTITQAVANRNILIDERALVKR